MRPRVGRARTVDDGRVETLLADRADARRERNYRLADGIRDELFEMGVEMDDKQRTWWVVGGGNVRPHDYARADDDGGTFVDGAFPAAAKASPHSARVPAFMLSPTYVRTSEFRVASLNV